MTEMNKLISAIVISLAVAISASAAEYLAAPDAPANGDGWDEKPFSLSFAVGPESPVTPGDVLILLPGTYKIPVPDNAAEAALDISVSGVVIAGKEVIIDGCIVINGDNVDIIGLNIGNIEWNPENAGRRRLPSVEVNGEGVRLINCNIFGGYGGGVNAMADAVDMILYGCLIHDYGALTHTRYPMDIGDVVYVQHSSGDGVNMRNDTGLKTLKHNVVYRGCRGNISSTSGVNIGYDYIENISFQAMAYKGNENIDNLCVAGNYGAQTARMDRIRVIGNVAYQTSSISGWRPNMRLYSYHWQFPGLRAEFRKNWLIGANVGLQLTEWDELVIEENVVWAVTTLIETPEAGMENWRVDRNSYFSNSSDKPFSGRSFEEWKELGFDSDGVMLEGNDGRPSGSTAFVFPNEFERNRAHVAVFNFEERHSYVVDLAGAVEPGTRIKIWNVWDIKGPLSAAKPVVETVYNFGGIELPLKNDPECPEFETFLILPVAN